MFIYNKSSVSSPQRNIQHIWVNIPSNIPAELTFARVASAWITRVSSVLIKKYSSVVRDQLNVSYLQRKQHYQNILSI